MTFSPVAPRAVASTPPGAAARPRLWHAFACFLLDGREPVPEQSDMGGLEVDVRYGDEACAHRAMNTRPEQTDRREQDDDLVVLVCECGVIAAGYAAARCGHDARRNIRSACPTKQMRIIAWEEVV